MFLDRYFRVLVGVESSIIPFIADKVSIAIYIARFAERVQVYKAKSNGDVCLAARVSTVKRSFYPPVVFGKSETDTRDDDPKKKSHAIRCPRIYSPSSIACSYGNRKLAMSMTGVTW